LFVIPQRSGRNLLLPLSVLVVIPGGMPPPHSVIPTGA
jgi:hypothetical protein